MRKTRAPGAGSKKDPVNQALALAVASSPEIRRTALAKLGMLANRLDLDLIDRHEEADHCAP